MGKAAPAGSKSLAALLVVVVAFSLLWWMGDAAASEADVIAAVPTATRPSLPPLPTTVPPTVPPTATPPPTPTVRRPVVTGAFIALLARGATPEMWTVVQWQDGWGAWHDVAGWQGGFDALGGGWGTKRWWLAADLLGRGPFRWQIRQGRAGETLAVSYPFCMPASLGATVQVSVTLGARRASAPPTPVCPGQDSQ